ncbi:MAG: hypothetical protein N3E37_01285 [Candidatus Micrarchaeota archaeon]|nr:hypothetical protein [Candidatus Micrarchaeota archaeon]
MPLPNSSASSTKEKKIEQQEEQQKQQFGASKFVLPVELLSSIDSVYDKLIQLNSINTIKSDNKVTILNVITRDINKKPAIFTMIQFEENFITVTYTYGPGMSPKKKFLETMSFLLNILTILKDDYKVDVSLINQLLTKILDELKDFADLKYEALHSLYDNLNQQYLQALKELKNLKDANDQLIIDNYNLKTKNNQLIAKLEKFTNLSDDVLKAKIQEWIIANKGEIDIIEFAKVYNVYEGRVEEILRQLMDEGFLESK